MSLADLNRRVCEEHEDRFAMCGAGDPGWGGPGVGPPVTLWSVRSLQRMDTDQIANLLHEAAETHHVVYRITDGDDPDWASWYADWLLRLSELPQLLGSTPVRSQLVHALVQLDREYTAAGPDEPWGG